MKKIFLPFAAVALLLSLQGRCAEEELVSTYKRKS